MPWHPLPRERCLHLSPRAPGSTIPPCLPSQILLAARFELDDHLPLTTPTFHDLSVDADRGSVLYIQQRLLVEKGGANTRAVAKLQHQPLHVACLANRGSVVRYLLSKGGADAEVADKNGNRPLHLALEANKLESIRELLKHG